MFVYTCSTVYLKPIDSFRAETLNLNEKSLGNINFSYRFRLEIIKNKNQLTNITELDFKVSFKTIDRSI